MINSAEAEAQDAQVAQLLTAAEEQIERLEAEPDAPDRTARLLQASLLTQLAAALLFEPDFPAGPQGREQRQDRERARWAVRFLLARHERRARSLTRKVPDLALSPKRAAPRTEADEQLATQSAAAGLSFYSSAKREWVRLDLSHSVGAEERKRSGDPNEG